MSQTEVQLIKADAVQTADIANSAVTDAKISALTSSKLSGALPAISGASLTNLPASGKAHNLVINGAMQVAQYGLSSDEDGYNTCDRFRYDKSGTDNNPTQAQVDVASGTTPYTLGFRKAFKLTNGNQSSGAGANDLIAIKTRLEAQDIANSGWNYTSTSSYITLSFWVKSSVAQNFYGYIRSYDGTSYLYPFETGSLSANTWTKVTKTIAGNSNLQFDNDANLGLEIDIVQFYGTTYTDPGVSLNTWQTVSNYTPNNTSTWYTTNDATFELTGVQLEVGDSATDFEHLSFADALTRCERYYQLIAPSVAEALISDTHDYDNTTYFTVDLHTIMRSAPSLIVGNHTDAFRLYGTNPRNVNTFSVNTGVTTTSRILLYATGGSSGAVGFARIFKNTSGNQSGGTYAIIAVSSEL